MNNNDLLRSLQHVLKLSQANMTDIFKLAQQTVAPAAVADMLKDAEEPGFMPCTDSLASHFLDGLISYRRGSPEKSKPAPAPSAAALDNNTILKKLRIAFDLKEDDLIELMSLAEYDTSKSEISAIFRKPGNKHYRLCSDDFLMGLLIGLTFRTWS